MFSEIQPMIIHHQPLVNIYLYSIFVILITTQQHVIAKAIDLLDASQLVEYSPNYCNNSELIENAGLIRSTIGQFLGFECSAEFFHCRWQSDGFRTYKKLCRPGLVYDTLGTQNCNYDYNVKGCTMRTFAEDACTPEQFLCPLSEVCVNMSQRCDGKYDCALEEDEQNCPICEPNYFPCVASEQCIPMKRRCDGFSDCSDHTDEMNCEVCPAGSFYCRKAKQCIDGSERCDGTEQCHTGEDEALCKFPKDQDFVCEDRNHKIPLAQLCDGIEQCPDKSDELYCYRNVDLPSMTFSQRSNPTASHSSVNFKETTSTGNGDERGNSRKIAETTEEILDYQAESTTMQIPTTTRKITRPLSTRVSSKRPSYSSRTALVRSSRRLVTTTTEPSTYSQEVTTAEQTPMQIESNYDDELSLATVPSHNQHEIEDVQSYETGSSSLAYPQFSINNSKKGPNPGVIKTAPQKAKVAAARVNMVPKVEVAHSADHFPFLQKSSAFQKASGMSGTPHIIDLTSNHPEGENFNLRRPTTRKQKKITVKEITVPFNERIQATTTSYITAESAKFRGTQSTKTTSTSSRRSFSSPSKYSVRPKLSTTRPPLSKTFETPEAAILESIESHLKREKGGRTLSPKEVLEKIGMLISKETLHTQQRINKDEYDSGPLESSVEVQHPSSPRTSYHRSSSYGVTQRPTTKWRPSLSSSPVRNFTSRIRRPTTRMPMMNYEDVQMRHSDAPNEGMQDNMEPQNLPLFPQFDPQKAITFQPRPTTNIRNSRSTAHSSQFQSAEITEAFGDRVSTRPVKVYDVSTFLMDVLKTTTAVTTLPPTIVTDISEKYQKPRNLPSSKKSSYPTKTTATQRTTGAVLLSNILDTDDQSSRI